MDNFMMLSTTQIKTDTILDLVLGAVKKFVLKNDGNAAYFFFFFFLRSLLRPLLSSILHVQPYTV